MPCPISFGVHSRIPRSEHSSHATFKNCVFQHPVGVIHCAPSILQHLTAYGFLKRIPSPSPGQLLRLVGILLAKIKRQKQIFTIWSITLHALEAFMECTKNAYSRGWITQHIINRITKGWGGGIMAWMTIYSNVTTVMEIHRGASEIIIDRTLTLIFANSETTWDFLTKILALLQLREIWIWRLEFKN